MSPGPYVSYLRSAGTGPATSSLASQREAVSRHLGRRGRLVDEVIESAADPQQPGLQAALSLCLRHGATLLMAELDPLSEDADFLRRLSRDLRARDLRFSAADRPEVSEHTLGIMAAVAEAETRLGVRRTPETMARRREFYARFTADRQVTPVTVETGVSIAGSPRPLAESLNRGEATSRSRERAAEVAPILSEIRAAGALTREQVANALNALGIPSARGSRWYPMQVTRIEKRLAAAAAREGACPGGSHPARHRSASERTFDGQRT
ncbi:resolvase [Methylorubrum populi]|uniref:Resolvase n=1 Tax=Methylorubrum populi TaxID=223967 RepID=A0A169QGA6_9HYPH|nr:recombinase family protein [Methylorubrum populi]BAU88856.1 resolvase [Methylorubrum populi]